MLKKSRSFYSTKWGPASSSKYRDFITSSPPLGKLQIRIRTMSIVPRDSGERSLSDEFFNRHRQLLEHFRSQFNFPSFFPFSPPSRSLPYSELAIETDGALASRLESKEIPEAYLLVADLPPGAGKDEVAVQIDDGDGSLSVRGEGGWGRFNWRLRLPENARLDQLGSSIENGVLTVVVPKAEVWGFEEIPSLPPPRDVRVVEITGSDD